jgi:hypothetical protein
MKSMASRKIATVVATLGLSACLSFDVFAQSLATRDAAAAATIPPMPPPALQKDEIVFTAVDDPVVKMCAGNENRMRKALKFRILKVVITRSPKWGTVWRADVAFPTDSTQDEPIVFRTTCWKQGIDQRPLQMFNPDASIPPLMSGTDNAGRLNK